MIVGRLVLDRHVSWGHTIKSCRIIICGLSGTTRTQRKVTHGDDSRHVETQNDKQLRTYEALVLFLLCLSAVYVVRHSPLYIVLSSSACTGRVYWSRVVSSSAGRQLFPRTHSWLVAVVSSSSWSHGDSSPPYSRTHKPCCFLPNRVAVADHRGRELLKIY
jgi:hypothetical protein